MSYQQYRTVAFGTSKAGKITVGYALYNMTGTLVGTRQTTVSELGDGQYGAAVTFPDGFRGRITWDTGESIPAYASEEINDGRLDLSQAVAVEDLSNKTTQNINDCLSAARSDGAGAMILDRTAKTQILRGPGGEIVRSFDIDDVDLPTRRD